MTWWPRLRSLRGSLTLRDRRGGSFSRGGSSAPSESVLEASLICSWTSGVDWEVLGTDSSNFNTCCSGPPPPGWGGADDTSRLQAAGSAWDTTRGFATLNTALAMLGRKSGSEKMGGKRCLCLSSKLSLYSRSRLGGSPTTFGASTSFCSVQEIALCAAVDHARPAPSREEMGGLLSPGVAMPRLPNNPSKRPICCQTNQDKQSDLGMPERFATQQLTHSAPMARNPGGKFPN